METIKLTTIPTIHGNAVKQKCTVHYHDSHEILAVENKWEESETHLRFDDSLVFIQCETGRLRIDIKDDHLILNPKQIAILPYMTVYKCTAITPCSSTSLYFSGRYVVQNIAWFPYINTPTVINKPSVYEAFRKFIMQITKTSRIERTGFEAYLKTLFYESYFLLSKNEQEKIPDWQGYFPQSFTTLLLYVHKHYTEPITLEDLRKAFNMTPQHIGRLFKQYIGMTYKTYVDTLRLEHAVFLLKNTQDPIIKIVYDAGFPNKQSFGTCFKKQFGCTPSSYRPR